MGTVGNQPERDSFETYSPDLLIDKMTYDAKECIRPHTLTHLIEAAKVVEMMRANDIAVQDGSYRDEHVAGIADRIEMIADAIHGENEIAIALNRIGAALEKIAEKMR